MTASPASPAVGFRRRVAAPHQRRQLTVTAACATLLAALPLATIFIRWTWLLDAGIVVAALCAVAVVARGARLPAWAPTAAMLAALPVVLAWQFPGQGELAGLVPGPGTLEHFNDLLAAAGTEMRQYGSPVQDRQSFLFLSTLGIGGVAILVDLFAVTLRRPAMAGLPMLAVYSVPVAIDQDSVNLLPFALGAMGFLWLLVVDSIDRVRRFGRRFSGDGRDIDLWEPSPLAAAGQRLGLIGVVLAVTLPLLVPGMTTGLLDRLDGAGGFGAGGIGGQGSGAGVELYAMLSGNLVRDQPFDMLRVRTEDPSPYYLRFAEADRLTTDGFESRAVRGGTPVTSTLPAPPNSAPGTAPRSQRASIEIINLDSSYLPIYQYPTRIERVDGSWRYEPNSGVVYSAKGQSTQKMKYSFEYVRPEYTAEALRAAPPVDRNDRLVRDALGVPRVPEVADLVGQLTAGRQTQYDAVMEIFNYFSRDNGFVYSLSTRPGDSGPSTRSDTGGSAIVDFLRYKQGYCVQYSAAMAWLVRQAGFPARVAFGFTRGAGRPGTWSTLTNFNLHAWTEVYFAGYGWVPFDPTPATGVSGSANPAWAPNPSRPQDPSGTAQDAGSAAPGPQASGSVGADAGQPDDPGAAAGDTGGSGGTPAQWPLWVVPGVLAALAVAAIPAWQRRRLRRRRLRMRALPVPGPVGRRDAAAGEPVVVRDREPDWEAARRAAHAAWDELRDSMIDYGLPVDGAETPRATAARLAGEALPDPATAGVRLLGRAEEHARYSRSPLPSGDLAPSLAAARAAFAARASRRTRLRVAILPPSMLRRWQFTVSEAIGGVAAATATWSETIMRNVRLRSRIGDRTAR